MRGPCEVWFYHLERTALDQALPELLEKTLAKGWRAPWCAVQTATASTISTAGCGPGARTASCRTRPPKTRNRRVSRSC